MKRRIFFKNLGAVMGAVMIAPNVTFGQAVHDSVVHDAPIPKSKIKGELMWWNGKDWQVISKKIIDITFSAHRETIDIILIEDDMEEYIQCIAAEPWSNKFDLTIPCISETLCHKLIKSNNPIKLTFYYEREMTVSSEGYVTAINYTPYSDDKTTHMEIQSNKEVEVIYK